MYWVSPASLGAFVSASYEIPRVIKCSAPLGVNLIDSCCLTDLDDLRIRIFGHAPRGGGDSFNNPMCGV